MARSEGGGDGRNADYYEVLGVPESATDDDITRAYRRLARQHHPDHNPVPGSKRFQEISDAYSVIGNAERRRRYDAGRRSGTGSSGSIRIPVRHGAPGAAQSPTGPAATADRPVIRLTAREAALGAVIPIDVTEEAPCVNCGGSGLARPPGPCPDCAGAGSVTRPTGQIPVRHICAACGGRGRPAGRACRDCGATGTTTTTRPLKVRIPPGVHDGATLRIRPKGRSSPFVVVVRIV